jgi:hypothetical protein
MTTITLKRLVEPQPTQEWYGWCWPIPEHRQLKGCATQAVTASREWWHYLPPGCCPIGNVGYVFCIGEVIYQVASIKADQDEGGAWVWVVACDEVSA